MAKVLGFYVFFVVAGTSIYASSVVPINVETLADQAGQVIIGRTASIRSFWAESPRRIESEITLQDVHYLKGILPDSTDSFRLVVPGGAIDGMEMRIGCAPTFATGEKWLLFLFPAYKTFPVVGLSQGAMRIVTSADDTERVYSAFGEPVTGIDARGYIKVAKSEAKAAEGRLLDSVNARLRLEPLRATDSQALTVEDFLTQLRPILARSQDHGLTEPAGRRMEVSHRGVPLQLAPRPAAGSAEPNEPRGLDAVRKTSAAPRTAPSSSEETDE